MSTRCFDQSCDLILEGSLGCVFAGIDREIWEPVMRVVPAYLRATFDEINQRYGSVERYFSKKLDISESARQQIRANLLA